MKKFFPSTFTIAVFLTFVTFILALIFTAPVEIESSASSVYHEMGSDPLIQSGNHLSQLIGFWYNGLWNTGMLAFMVQMMLILVLGYVLASTEIFKKIIEQVLIYCTSTAKAAFLVTLLTLLVSFFNWGLGLIFGALFARKVAERAKERHFALNYPLIGAAGYSGLMVWHGGISGSAPLKVAEPGHLKSLTGLDLAPVDFSQTIFSGMNIVVFITLIVILPIAMFWLGKSVSKENIEIQETETETDQKAEAKEEFTGAERFDKLVWAGRILGIIFLLIAGYKAISMQSLAVIDPNYLNFVLLGLGLLFSGSIYNFLKQVQNAMGAAAGILIQFPLYFGIMGIMRYSGLVEVFSNFLMNISNSTTFPLFTFLSAAIVNVFVPSGGGQWAVQGPIIIEAAQNLGIPLGKAVMALAYGDQVTNMLQPFWALPLLGITGLKAKDIISYTLFLMMIGIIIFIAGLLIF
ncbi:MAG: TIGR00366 family protein [Bacteroidetes bacterium]|nr:TIGR00366 family protein [Bacteroidota bacterium]